uniref:Translationally controlled tumor protein n=1 Tax=Solen grandis TaxID=165599 RepID=M1PVA8_9BIVA|nr:translationally controlled tumor protein [Solen grandis]
MIIFKDACTGDELFSDCFKMVSEEDDFLIGCCGQFTNRAAGGISAELLGANPSQEEQEEECEDGGAQTGIDICLNHNLEDKSDYFTDKKVITSYLKKWLKNVATKMAEDDKEKAEAFKDVCQKKIKAFLGKWTPDCSVYSGPHFDPEDAKSQILIGVWGEDGMSITMYGIKTCMLEEKQ